MSRLKDPVPVPEDDDLEFVAVEGVEITGVLYKAGPQDGNTIDKNTTDAQIRALTGSFVVIGSKVQEKQMQVLSEMKDITQAVIRCSNGYQIIKKLPETIRSVVIETSQAEIFSCIPSRINEVGLSYRTLVNVIKQLPPEKTIFVISELRKEQLEALPGHIKVLYVLEEHITVNKDECSQLKLDIEIKNMKELRLVAGTDKTEIGEFVFTSSSELPDAENGASCQDVLPPSKKQKTTSEDVAGRRYASIKQSAFKAVPSASKAPSKDSNDEEIDLTLRPK
ncbi:MAG: hypothetical protein KDH94_06255 [Coxiellaceae bacterium]|nr:hypothetical protein [Coxiellaceae bacterium]